MRFNLRAKLFATSGTILLFLIILSGVGIFQLQHLEEHLNIITDTTAPTVEQVDDLLINLWKATTVAEEALAEEEAVNVDAFVQEVLGLNSEFEEILQEVRKVIIDPELQANIEQAHNQKSQFDQRVQEMAAAHKLELEHEIQTNELLGQYDTLGEDLAAELAKLDTAAALNLEIILLKIQVVANKLAAEVDPARLAGHRQNFDALVQQRDVLADQVNSTQIRALLTRQDEVFLAEEGMFHTQEQHLSNEYRADQLMDEAEAQIENVAGLLDTTVAQAHMFNDVADDEAEAQVRAATWTIIGVGLTAIVIGLIISFFLAQSIANSANMVARAAAGIAAGDLAQSIVVKSRDELGDMALAFQGMVAYMQEMAEAAGRLARGDVTVNIKPQSDKDVLGVAFQQMIVNLRNLIGQVIDTANTVGTASGQLTIAAEQAGQASQQVASTIQQIAQGTTQQTAAVTEATNNIEQVTRASEGIAQGAQEQANGVQKTSTLVGEMAGIVQQVGQVAGLVSDANTRVTQAARAGVAAVDQTGQGMETIRTRTLVAADKVKEMGIRSKEIGRIVETIDDIADKTDMLALNAAVEAARAGEHGRGFAVVADQVRKLSEDSKSATRDISDLIERVQETVREAIGAMDNTVTEVGAGTRLAGDTANSLEEILKAAEEAAILAERITGAVTTLKQKSEGVVAAIEAVSAVVEENTAVAEEMAASTQEVMEAMEGVASVAEENSAASEEVSASAEEMSAQVEEVVASSQELSELAEQLRAAVAQFRVENSSSGPYEQPRRASNGRSAPVLTAQAGNYKMGY